MKIPESAIQSHIIQYLTMRGHFVMRLNSGMVENKYGGRIRLSPAGTPDLLVISKGKVIFIEIKAEKGKVTELQKAKMEELESHGAKCYVARSIEDVQSFGL